MRNPRRGRPERRGIEAVEAAITLPLLMIATFTGLQIAHKLHVETLLKIAGSEAMIAGGREGGTLADAERVFDEHCSALGLKDCQLLNAENLDGNNEPHDLLRLSPVARSSSNRLPLPMSFSLSGQWIYGGDVYYRREGESDDD